ATRIAAVAIARTVSISTIVHPSEEKKDPEPRERLRASGRGLGGPQGSPLSEGFGESAQGLPLSEGFEESAQAPPPKRCLTVPYPRRRRRRQWRRIWRKSSFRSALREFP